MQNLAMGGYGIYVWSSYGLALLILIIVLSLTVYDQKKIKTFLKNYFKNNEP